MWSKIGSLIKLIPPARPSRPLCQKRRVSLAAGKSDAELEPVFFNQSPKALAEELVHMAQACAIVDLTMGAGTWATVALEQGLPCFGVALTDTRYHEAIDHLKGEAGIAETKRAAISVWVSELESV